MKGRPLLSFTICWMCGSVMACALTGWTLIWGLIGALACLPLLLRFIDVRGWSVLFLLAAFIGGAAHWEWNDSRNHSSLPETLHIAAYELDGWSAEIQGELVSDVRIDGDRADFKIQMSAILPLSDSSADTDLAASSAFNIDEQLMVQVRLLEEEEQQVAAGWKRGDLITLNGSFVLPGEARNFGGFDYRSYLRTLHIHWLFKVKGASSVTVVAPEGLGQYNVLRWTDWTRHKLGLAVEQLFPEPHAGYMKGLIIGMATDIDPGTYGQFSQLGLTHILAISGTHVAVYVASLLLILSWLRLTRETALTIVLILVPAYVLLSGGSPSVIRAGIMSMIGLYMARRGLARDGLQMISAAALLMMWWDPYFLLSVSFQLSFLVTAGLMIYMPLINRLFSSWPKSLAATASVTVTAQLISFPVTILYFNQFSLLSFVANFLLVSLISAIVLPLGTVAMLLSFIWVPLAKPLAWIAMQLNQLTFVSVEWMNSLPGFVLIWATPPLLWIAAYYAVLYALLYLLHRGNGEQQETAFVEEETAPLVRGQPSVSMTNMGIRSSVSTVAQDQGKNRVDGKETSLTTLGASIAWPEYTSAFTARGAGYYAHQRMSKVQRGLCGLLAISFVAGLWWAYQTPKPAGTGIVQFLDIGQGDSTLITTPEGKHILVDGGGTVSFGNTEHSWKTRRDPYEVGAKVVVPLLKKRGIHQLDAVIVTHADQDHAGGLQAVLEQIPVKRFMFNGTTSGKDNFDKLLNTAMERKIPLYAIRQGMSYKVDKETSLHFIAPDLAHMDVNVSGSLPVSEHQNHDSVVFLLDMAGTSMLFTGDMDAAAEQDLLYMIQDGSLAAQFEQKGADIGVTEGVVQRVLTRPLQGNLNDASASVSIDVLKVAHHGSKTSSTEAWLQYWNARTAVISAGVNNTYGHPNPGVMERLEAAGSDIYRTDQMGEVQMRVKDGEIAIRYKLVGVE
ncbi:ComEC/Rec2 family competence protein [Paenibacillus sp. CFBP 13594]|uniref:ComEC/Rec2 family competence protein n=1 Tax=Paenibacillus sp. CFBP 13594 TaxID=2774037 RepID=UPI001781134C|nr:ComEC/Rec2 family competence protein [Paenibacillus sp. CFBP 13594]MBD8839331.1 ComEC/Rec2 family competence protein [Paenibacillus sp. CFBP 13594]